MSKSDAQLISELMEIFAQRVRKAVANGYSEDDAVYMTEASLDIQLLGQRLSPERIEKLEAIIRRHQIHSQTTNEEVAS
jgi:transposase